MKRSRFSEEQIIGIRLGRSGTGNPDAEGRERKKVVTPALRREAAEYLKKSYSVGLRRICGLLQVARSTNQQVEETGSCARR